MRSIMTKDEFTKYWLPARRFEIPRGGVEASRQLATRLGFSYPESGSWKLIPLTYELKNILRGLAGPHRETLNKIYQIKRRHKYEQKRRAYLRQIKQDDRHTK